MDSLPPFASFAVFVLVSVTTPGPNNIMTLHSGARYGIARTFPLIIGIQLGFAVMIALIALSSSIILMYLEDARLMLRLVCFGYLLFLAWRIATAPLPHLDRKGPGDITDNSMPIGALEAALFQWVNPKAWAVGIAAVGTYNFLFSGTSASMIGFSATFLCVGFPSSFVWAYSGKFIGSLLKSPVHFRAFSVISALLMIAALVPALLTI